ncbi:MAG: hypothetical protein IPF59_14040 [Ignavibacteria bacterium]|nr:hypothetical protein [Ignavibacteria bacterium]
MPQPVPLRSTVLKHSVRTALHVHQSTAFAISARGRVSLGLSAFPRVDGPSFSTIRIRSTVAGDRTVVVRGIAATRSMSAPPTISFGDVRVGTSLTNRVAILNSGTAPVTVRAVAITGAQSAEYAFVVVGGVLPYPCPCVLMHPCWPKPSNVYHHHGRRLASPSDTLIQLSTAGLVCGTMYVDTIYADVEHVRM